MMHRTTDAPQKSPAARRVGLAVSIAVACCIGAGAGYRIVSAYLARPTDSVPMTAEQLGRIPLKLEDWSGKEVPLADEIVRATDTDAIVNRSYTRAGSGLPVALYVAYGVQARDMMPHRPEVCYPGTGHTLQSRDVRKIALADGSELPCTFYVFSGSKETRQNICVVNYYVIDGRYAEDVSMLRSRAIRGQGGARYVAQVMLTCPTSATGPSDRAREVLSAFARLACPAIRAVLPGGARWEAEGPETAPAGKGPGGTGS